MKIKLMSMMLILSMLFSIIASPSLASKVENELLQDSSDNQTEMLTDDESTDDEVYPDATFEEMADGEIPEDVETEESSINEDESSISLMATENPDVALMGDNTLAEGVFGDTLTWKVTEDKTLFIDGTGNMPDFSSASEAPWSVYSGIIGDGDIEKVIIANGVTGIGEYSFADCSSLKYVVLGSGITHIAYDAFSNAGIMSIEVDDENNYYSSDDYGVLFDKYKSILIQYPVASDNAEYEISDTVTVIDENAFTSSANTGAKLESVIVPATVEDIGAGAFAFCQNLKSVSFSDGIDKINNNTFKGCISLEEIYLPDTVVSIGDGAFEKNTSLKSITVPDGATDIGSKAFASCSALESITLPASITSIGSEAFAQCDSLKTVYYGDTPENWNLISKSEGNETLDNVEIKYTIPLLAEGDCGTDVTWTLDTLGTLTISGNGAMTDWSQASAIAWYDYSSAIKNVVIEDGVTTVGNYAFCGLSNLRTVYISEDATKIGNSAFNGCVLLNSVVIPKNVSAIGWSAFYNCMSLKTLTFHNTVTSIGASAFNKCSVLSDIYYYGNEEEWSAITPGSNNTPLSVAVKHYIVPESSGNYGLIEWNISSDGTLTLTGSGQLANAQLAATFPWYAHRNNIVKAVVGEGITRIGNYAFCGYPYLTDVVIASTVRSIGNSVFNGSKAIKSITIPQSVTEIGWSAFYNCTGLEHVALAEKITKIGSGAFNNCSALKYVYFYGTEAKWNGMQIEANNTFLTNAARTYVSSGISGASGECGNSLTWKVDSDMTLTISGTGAMTNWSAAASTPWYDYRNRIKNIVIENGATNIGSYAFCGFSALESISIPESVASIGNSTFNTCTSLKSIELPSGLTSIGWSVFYGCTSLYSVKMSNGITSIGASAFYKCSDLKEVHYSGTEEQWNLITIGTNNEALTSNTKKYFGNIINSGSCGASLTWELNKYGELAIDGNGAMTNWDSQRIAPWISYADKINKVTIGENVTTIGNNAFLNCTKIKSVNIPMGITTIGASAFENCAGISVISIPMSVVSIGKSAFSGCVSLKKFAVSEDSISFETDSQGVLFTAGGDTLLCYPAGNSALSYDIPSGTSTIAQNAFYGSSNLTMIMFSETVKTVEANAFAGCSNIADVFYSDVEEKWNDITFAEGNEALTGANIHYMYVETIIAEGSCGKELTWKLNDAGILVISGSGNMESWATEDGAPWHEYASSVKNIIFEEGITEIGNYAFGNIENITSVRLPESVTTIGDYAFAGCSNIASISFPAKIAHIGNGAFNGLGSDVDVFYASTSETWSKVSIGDDNEELLSMNFHFSVDDNIIESGSCGENLIWSVNNDGILTISGNGDMPSWEAVSETPWYAHYSTVERIVIENGVTSVGSYAFCNFSSLKNVSIANTVVSIGNSAFNSCIKLNEIVLPKSVTSIGWSAFYNCNTMYKATFHSTLQTIGASAFYKCSLLSDVYYYGNGEQWEKTNFSSGNTALSGATKHFIISGNSGSFDEGFTWELSSNGTLTINGSGDMMSWSDTSETPWYPYRSSITKIVIGDGITSVGEYAFSKYPYLTDIVIADSVAKIDHSAFREAPLLQSVILPDNLVTLGWNVFYNCSSLSNVTFGSKIESIGSSAFNSCSALKFVYYYGNSASWSKVSIGNNNPYLTKATKYYVESGSTGESGIDGTNITWSADENGTLTISGKGNMKSFSQPTETPWYGLRNEIKKIVIENGITSVGDYAFCGFKAATEVNIPQSVTSIGNSSFNACVSLKTVTIPNAVTTIGWSAFYICYGLESVYLPESLIKIGASAFYNCKNLTDVYYDGTETQWDEILIGVDNNAITNDTKKHFGNILYKGSYGNNLSWQIEKSGVLTINGTGEIPETIASSSEIAWNEHNSLITEITIGEGITGIGSYAFRDMTVSEINVPSSVENISEYAFASCVNLENINISSNNESYACDEYGVVFNIDKTVLICAPARASIMAYSIPDTVSSIEAGAFDHNTVLEQVVLAEGINIINQNTFYGCSNLKNVTIPASVTNIDSNAFNGCESLADVYCGHNRKEWQSVNISDEGNTSFINAKKTFTLPSGECGDNLIWELSDDGVLTISGEGDMTTWNSETEVPWYPYASEIVSVQITDGVTGISSYAFKDTFIEEINIPATVTYVAEGAFDNCMVLRNINIDPNNTSYICDEYGVLFNYDMSVLIYSPAGSDKLDYIIPDTTHIIEPGAFNSNTNLLTVTLPLGISIINEKTFYGCANLQTVTIPVSVSAIDSNAFYGCDSLGVIYCEHNEKQWQSVVISDEGNSSFINAQKVFTLPSGTCGDELTWELSNEGVLTISGTGHMTSWESETEVPWYEYASDIYYVQINEGAESIGSYAFKDTFAEEISIPSTVTFIDKYAFDNCLMLRNIIIDNGNTSYICDEYGVVFSYDKSVLVYSPAMGSITEYTVPETVFTIESGAFANNTLLTAITLPEGINAIGQNTFLGCVNLETLKIPASVTNIEENAFSGCDSIATVYCGHRKMAWASVDIAESGNDSLINAKKVFTIPSGKCGDNLIWELSDDGILTINGSGDMTSWTCEADVPWSEYVHEITTVRIGEGVTSVGDYAFSGHFNLSGVSVATSVTHIGNSSFKDCNALTGIIIPRNVKTIGEYAFFGCNSITEITMYKALSEIGNSAFEGCTRLKTVYYYGTELNWSSIKRGSNNDVLPVAILHLLDESDGAYKLSASSYVASGNIVIKAKTDKVITDQHLHIALYSSSSSMIDYIIVPMDEAFDRVNVVFKDNPEAKYAKVFLWESFTSLAPVTEAITVEIPR